jgi:hypothetical protein
MIFESQLAPIPTRQSRFQPETPPRLQRKCACGGTPGPSGECEECKRKRLSLQTKLTVNQPRDQYEQEADRVAERVMSGKSVNGLSSLGADSAGHRDVTRTAPAIVHEALQTGGQHLDAKTHRLMGQRFGHDFGRVRIHTDAKATESARALHADAYAVGEDVVFAAGRYAPVTNTGQKLLAHELAHVVQQNATRLPVGLIQRQQSSQSGGWHPAFPGCSPKQDRRLDFQITFARTRVEQTIDDLEEFLTKKPSRVEVMTDTEYGLLRDFGTTEPAYVKRIIAGFGKILNRLQKGAQNWRCADEVQCQKICGKVPFACAAPGIPVTFCPPHFAEGDGYGTMILIHETGHQAGFGFHTYDPVAARTKMQSKDIAITSADSFASLVDSLTLGGPRIPGHYSLEEKVEIARQEVKAAATAKS